MKAKFLQRNVQKALSSLLVIWLSGLMFLFCCEMPKAQAAETDSCPLAKASHCDKKTSAGEISQFASVQTKSRAIDCCRMMTGVFDKARKTEQNPQTSVIASVIKVSLPKPSAIKSSVEIPPLYHPPVLNRGGTYLKNRVFRI